MHKPLAVVLVALIGLVGSVGQAFSWGRDDHCIVAAIAINLLPPAKAAALDKLLRESHVNRGFIEASGFADDVLRATHDFDGWHYVDWPDDSNNTADQQCHPTCVLRALTDPIDIAKKSTDSEEKALALSWIIHLIGNMHQPLHVADRDKDKGGNGFGVTYKGMITCGPRSFPVAPKCSCTRSGTTVWFSRSRQEKLSSNSPMTYAAV